MTSILETEITKFLTTELGRAPTAAEIANGLISPWPLAYVHNTLNVPQSIFSIVSASDIQTALDNLSANGGGVLNVLPGNYVLTQDLEIPTGVFLNGAGPSNTLLLCNAGYRVKCHGTSMAHKNNVGLTNIGVYNCPNGAAIDFQYVDGVIFQNVEAILNTNGILIDHCTLVNFSTTGAITNAGYGITLSNSSICDWRSVNSIGNTSAGLIMNTVSTFFLSPGDFEGNTGNGITMTSCSNMIIVLSATSNGGKGIELVSGNDNISITAGAISGNTSDGVKLTATSDNCKLHDGNFASNGGYGINIAAASCDNTLISGNILASNSSGAVHDSGTTTLIRSNIGVADAP